MVELNSSADIQVAGLAKKFSFRHRPSGLAGLVNWGQKKTKVVFDNFDLSLRGNQTVGLIGPNGAGKTTLLKLLTGVIYPDAGEIRVLGFRPQKRRKQFLSQIGFLMGNKTHLWWNLPVIDSYNFFQVLYQINNQVFKADLKEFADFLEISYLLDRPVRELSLGERMRCQILVAFIHRPKLVFLDEPTLALDIISQEKIQNFIKYYQAKFKSLIVVTSHYMKDIRAMADEVVIINAGKLLFQGSIGRLKLKLNKSREVKVVLPPTVVDVNLAEYSQFLSSRLGQELVFILPQSKIVGLVKFLLANFSVSDLSITEIDIETIVKRYFQRR